MAGDIYRRNFTMAMIAPKMPRMTIRGIRSVKRSVMVVVRFPMSEAATFNAVVTKDTSASIDTIRKRCAFMRAESRLPTFK